MNRGAAPVPPSNPYAAMLTQAQRQQISETFEVFDTDGSGTLSKEEVLATPRLEPAHGTSRPAAASVA